MVPFSPPSVAFSDTLEDPSSAALGYPCDCQHTTNERVRARGTQTMPDLMGKGMPVAATWVVRPEGDWAGRKGCPGRSSYKGIRVIVHHRAEPSGRRTETEVAMAMGRQSLGLCSTCNSRATCVQRKGISLPVLLCEEFDDSTPLPAQKPAPTALPTMNAFLDTTMGLCCNCGSLDSCRLRHSPGGIWHCEEYC